MEYIIGAITGLLLPLCAIALYLYVRRLRHEERMAAQRAGSKAVELLELAERREAIWSVGTTLITGAGLVTLALWAVRWQPSLPVLLAAFLLTTGGLVCLGIALRDLVGLLRQVD